MPEPTGAGGEHPYDVVTAALADIAERAVEYADIWRSAIARNAAGDYKPEHALVDVQALWGLAVRDVARAGAAVVEALAPLVPRDAPGGDASAAPKRD